MTKTVAIEMYSISTLARPMNEQPLCERKGDKGSSMDFDQAVGSHVQWKIKLRTAIANKHSLDATSIAKDDQCVLGQWLKGAAAAKYGHLATFKECSEAHAAFHRSAGKVAQCVNHGLSDQADELMANEYLAASNRAIVAIQHLKNETLQAAR